MAEINKKLIHFKNKKEFSDRLANGDIKDTSIVFIKDTQEIWTHGQLYRNVYLLDINFFDTPEGDISEATIKELKEVINNNCPIVITYGENDYKSFYLSSFYEYVDNDLSESHSINIVFNNEQHYIKLKIDIEQKTYETEVIHNVTQEDLDNKANKFSLGKGLVWEHVTEEDEDGDEYVTDTKLSIDSQNYYDKANIDDLFLQSNFKIDSKQPKLVSESNEINIHNILEINYFFNNVMFLFHGKQDNAYVRFQTLFKDFSESDITFPSTLIYYFANYSEKDITLYYPVRGRETSEEVVAGEIVKITIDPSRDLILSVESEGSIYNQQDDLEEDPEAELPNIMKNVEHIWEGTNAFGEVPVTFTGSSSDNSDNAINAGTGLTMNGTTINHTNAITGGTKGSTTTTTASSTAGSVPVIGGISYDSEGHITNVYSRNITLSNTTYSTASSTYSGLVRLGNDYTIGTAVNPIDNNIDSNCTYAILKNSSNQLMVNVPCMRILNQNQSEVIGDANKMNYAGVYRLPGTVSNTPISANWGNILVVRGHNWSDSLAQLFFNNGSTEQRVWLRSGDTSANADTPLSNNSNDYRNKSWREFAFTDSNVASADTAKNATTATTATTATNAVKLQTPRNIWGQSFDGVSDVNGTVTINSVYGIRHISANSNNYGVLQYHDGSSYYILITNKGAPNGTQSSRRPFYINLDNNYIGLALTPSENLGVGVYFPTYKLQVDGTGYFSGYCTFNGGAGTSSDIRYKTNIVPLNNVLDDVKKLDIFSYTWKKDGQPEVDTFGVSAQQLEELGGEFAKIVHEGNDEDKTKSVEYDRLGIIALKAIQEQQKIIEELKAKIEELEKKINE